MNAPTARSGGKLERVLRAGAFAVTAETSPGLSTDPAAPVARVKALKGIADAVNVTDGAAARAHCSSLVTAGLLARAGIEPVLQFTCRDRNRLALQGDVLGAATLGIANVLILSGDAVDAGDEPEAKAVNDFTSAQFTGVVARMRDAGELNSGRKIDGPPKLFIGVADLPFAPPPDWRPDGLLAKIEAGADFVQTQYCFDMARARAYFARLADFGIPERVKFLVGIGPLASARQARWMDQNLFGVDVPAAIIDRIAAAEDERAEGRRICVELIQQLADIPGVAGAHLMAPRQEEAIARAIEESGIIRGRTIS